MKYISPSGSSYTVYNDALSQPHLLIAGATKSGKSVLINGMVYNALYHFPDEIQFILIDPKRVELRMYKDLPHTLIYASEPYDMVNALKYAIDLCDNRFQDMQARNLKTYDGSHVYVIIDEWADLMTTQKKVVMPIVQRLAQIGRASNIHVWLATQTPISKILPTEIKCNFDTRFGLRTRSAQDSRNILGVPGLETLPQYGECIYMSPDVFKKYKVPYFTDDILKSRVNWWTSQNRKKGLLQRIFKR